MSANLIIENYFERLLDEEIETSAIKDRYDAATLADFRCTVLNQLPARYIRSRVDLAFFQSTEETTKDMGSLQAAITEAHRLISLRSKG